MCADGVIENMEKVVRVSVSNLEKSPKNDEAFAPYGELQLLIVNSLEKGRHRIRAEVRCSSFHLLFSHLGF